MEDKISLPRVHQILPKDKIKITTLDKEAVYEELSKIDNPWEFLRKAAGIIEGTDDASVEHDHYIRA